MSESKYQACVREPEMFKLYTIYIDRNPVVWTRHIGDLVKSLKEASGIEDEEQLYAILLAFSWLSSPAYAENGSSLILNVNLKESGNCSNQG
ncbi:hypothetical protein [Oceanobacillus kimchii]|uniref:hypothetical protein n=1 Tax=Oceanobacillus kimchii TaxID=746691 RepID=UPI0018A82EDA|nr:hypothetical protein [Oceanobacillus kimchii]